MRVKINGVYYKIKEVEKVILSENQDSDSLYFGLCDYAKGEIHLLKTLSKEQKRKTLTHELTHAYLFEHGHHQNDQRKYNYEEVCDIMGSFAEPILNVVNKYFK